MTTPINDRRQEDDTSDYSCNMIANRRQEKSVSDFSAFSAAISAQAAPVTPPPSKYRRKINRAMQDDMQSNISGKSGISGYSAMQVQTFNSNKRKQELSQSDNVSDISAPKSPFLQLKTRQSSEDDSPAPKAGNPFEFIQPVTFAETDIG